jgi:hypothetical protein
VARRLLQVLWRDEVALALVLALAANRFR